MHILGLLGMYFDAVLVEVKAFFTFIQIGSGHTVFDQWIEETNERSKMIYEFLCLKILCIF